MQPTPEINFPSPILTITKRLGECWTRYRAELKRIRAEFAEEYVHDLRVATRRLMAIMDMGRAVTHQKKIKRVRTLLKSQVDAFDKLRDIQVQLIIVEEMLTDLPEIFIYRDYLQQREKQQVLRLQKKIKEFSASGLSHQVTRLESALLAKSALEVENAIFAAVDVAYARAVQNQQVIQPENTATIHRVRLTFKKFRYRVESISPLIPNAPKDLLLQLHNYQAAMGEIQDAEVGLQMFDHFILRNGTDISGIRAKFVEMHQSRVAVFLAQTDKLQNFWRAASDQSFPWETKQVK